MSLLVVSCTSKTPIIKYSCDLIAQSGFKSCTPVRPKNEIYKSNRLCVTVTAIMFWIDTATGESISCQSLLEDRWKLNSLVRDQPYLCRCVDTGHPELKTPKRVPCCANVLHIIDMTRCAPIFEYVCWCPGKQIQRKSFGQMLRYLDAWGCGERKILFKDEIFLGQKMWVPVNTSHQSKHQQ